MLVTASYRQRRERSGEVGGGWLVRADQADDRGQLDGVPVLEPPLRLALVARGERELGAGHDHGDRDELRGLAGGAVRPLYGVHDEISVGTWPLRSA